ncbi:MAG: hypothetical protein ACXVHV_01350 [Methanobacterium sp.]
MNLSNIKAGDVIPKYSKMCELLEVNQKSTGCRKKHENEWKLYFNFKKNGHKYIILEIYNKPKPKVDGRRNGNNSKYVKHTPSLLLDYLYLNSSFYYYDNSNVIDKTNKDIMLAVGLCNKNYNNEEFLNTLYSNNAVNRLDTMLFYQVISAKAKEIIGSTFKNLQRNEILNSVEKAYIINDDKEFRPSTKEEYNLITKIHIQVLEELEIKNMFHLHVKNKQKLFYERVSEITKKSYNWKIICETNRMALNELHDDFYTNKGKVVLGSKRLDYKNNVNNYFLKYLHLSIEKKFETHNKKFIINTRGDESKKYNGDLSTSEIYSELYKDFYKLPCDYVEKQKLLTNLLIKL